MKDSRASGRAHSRPTSSKAPRHVSLSYSHVGHHTLGGGLPFRVLSAVLKFLCAPLEHSLWWVAVVAAWMGFSGFVFLLATAGMMLSPGQGIIADGFVIALGASGLYMVSRWL